MTLGAYKLAVVFLLSRLPCCDSLLNGSEVSEATLLFGDRDRSPVAIMEHVIANADGSRPIIGTPSSIDSLLALISFSQIVPAIIKCDTRTVVYLPSFATRDYNCFHINPSPLSSGVFEDATGIKALPSLTPFGIPLVLIKPIEIVLINDGKLSLSKRDKAIRWKRRHNILCKQVGHIQPSKAGLMCRHFTLHGASYAV
jgi:hypothetical protein